MGLNRFNVLVIGAGALGGAILAGLVRAGVLSIAVADGDIVMDKNLANQPIFTKEDVSMHRNKAEAAVRHFSGGTANLSAEPFYIGESRIAAVIAGKDMVIDATDNAESRLVINDACVMAGIPLLITSLKGPKGLLYIVDGRGACFNCIHRNGGRPNEEGCASVTARRAETLGEIAVDEALCFLEGRPNGGFVSVNADTGEMLRVEINRDPMCETCSAHSYTHRLDGGFVQLCADGIKFSLQRELDLAAAEKRVGGVFFGENGGLLRVGNGNATVLISKDGDFLFSGYDKKTAKAFISRVLSSVT